MSKKVESEFQNSERRAKLRRQSLFRQNIKKHKQNKYERWAKFRILEGEDTNGESKS